MLQRERMGTERTEEVKEKKLLFVFRLPDRELCLQGSGSRSSWASSKQLLSYSPEVSTLPKYFVFAEGPQDFPL